VKTQSWTAVAVYVLVAIVKKRLGLERSLYAILQILSISLFEKEPIFQVLSRDGFLFEEVGPEKQLSLLD
jgi:hypothetical protein